MTYFYTIAGPYGPPTSSPLLDCWPLAGVLLWEGGSEEGVACLRGLLADDDINGPPPICY